MSTVSKYRATPPISLGDTEQLAGIEDRAAFWKKFSHLHGAPMQVYVDAGMAACDKMIRQRVEDGLISLLFDPAPAREARAKRIRAAKVAA